MANDRAAILAFVTLSAPTDDAEGVAFLRWLACFAANQEPFSLKPMADGRYRIGARDDAQLESLVEGLQRAIPVDRISAPYVDVQEQWTEGPVGPVRTLLEPWMVVDVHTPTRFVSRLQAIFPQASSLDAVEFQAGSDHIHLRGWF